ncbi:hypothetical protein ACWCRD_13265 [Streptomyces sp. NPDC002092]
MNSSYSLIPARKPADPLPLDLGAICTAGISPAGVEGLQALLRAPQQAVVAVDFDALPAVRLLADRRARGGTSALVYSAPTSENEAVPELASCCDLRVNGPEGVAALLAAVERALASRHP